MRFQFSLATVLRLREIAEEREERLLGQILNQMAHTRQKISDLQVKRAHLVSRREDGLSRQISAAELQIAYGHMNFLDEQQQSARDYLARLEVSRQQQVKVYEAAHQARDLLAGMREEQLEEFRREQTRQEQSAMDDNFIARRSRR